MGDTMSGTPQREEIDVKVATVEARADTKFAQVLREMRTGFATLDGKLVALNTRMAGLERVTAGTKTTIILTGIAIAGALVAILAYGQAWFGLGLANRDTIKAVVTEVIQQQAPHK